MPRIDRSPVEEIANRVATSVAGLKVAAGAVGMEDHRRMLRDNARRVADSHRAAMKQLGFASTTEGDEMEEDMGNIIVTGDITIGDNGRNTQLPWESPRPTSPAATQQPAPTAPAEPKPGMSNLAKAGLAALALSGPVGGLAGYFLSKPSTNTTVVQPGDGTGIGLLPPSKPQTK